MNAVSRRNVVIAVIAVAGFTPIAAAQPAQTRVTYEVELSTLGSLLDDNCSATGTDVLAGTLVGLEPPEEEHDDNEYVGRLTRSTRISIGGTRRKPDGTDVVCSMSISGNAEAYVILTVYGQGRGGWLKYLDDPASWAHLLPSTPPSLGPVNNQVNGTCDPGEMAEMQAAFHEGQTAGSPSGQGLEVTGMPTSGFPKTFPAKPPETIWTLKVLSRRP